MSAGIEIVRNARARRIRLSVDPTSGTARLTLPRRAALKPALKWAEQQAEWLAVQRAPWPRAVRVDTENGVQRAVEQVLTVLGPDLTERADPG